MHGRLCQEPSFVVTIKFPHVLVIALMESLLLVKYGLSVWHPCGWGRPSVTPWWVINPLQDVLK